jgi:uncharacterized Rmd1/YagE family protein
VKSLLPEVTQLRAQAYLLGQRLSLRGLEAESPVHPLVVTIGERGCCAIFRYGAVVFFNTSDAERTAFLEQLQPRLSQPYAEPETEEVELRIEPGRRDPIDGDGAIILHEVELERLQLVAEVLAKSVVLAQYEHELGSVFDLIEPLAAELSSGNRGRRKARELLRHIGGALLIQHKMVGRVEITEKPELLWERPKLERLYARLDDEYELHERNLALERKLSLVSQTAQTMLEVLQTSRSLRVEWYIVLLIVIEILLTLYTLFLHTPATPH